jgi:sphingolipid delta-4 desaturase
MVHHDFPSIPGSLLPEVCIPGRLETSFIHHVQVKKMAPEFYDHLPSHTSWVWCMYDFIMNPEMGPYARIKRKLATEDDDKSY